MISGILPEAIARRYDFLTSVLDETRCGPGDIFRLLMEKILLPFATQLPYNSYLRPNQSLDP